MAFIGNQPALAYTSFAVQHFTTSATTSYTLNYPVANENEIRLVINNVVQQPGSSYAYTASGTSLTLSAATTATDTMYAVFLGKAVQTVNPPNGSVGLSQLSATGTKDSTTFLRGDNTFSTVTSGLTEADQWRLTTAFTTTGDNDITSNLERVDTTTGQTGLPLGTGMTQSSGVFTFPSTGYYLIAWNASLYNGSSDAYIGITLRFSTDSGSTYTDIGDARGSVNANYDGISGIAILDITNTSTNKIKFQALNIGSGSQLDGSTTNNLTYFTFTKLGNT